MILRQRRTGVTLTEVLVALFVLALGILALMSMFPLAAYQMAQSFKDDRAATLAANSETIAKIMWRTAWESTTTPGGIETNETVVFGREPGLAFLDNPGAPLNGLTTTSSGPSYPVYFDPIGVNAASSASGQAWVGPYPGYLRRSSIAIANTLPPASCIRTCSVLDDMTFNTVGLPDTSTGLIDRGGQFSVAWLIQRRKNNIRAEANVTVVVYSKRPPAVTPSLEYTFSGTVNNGTTAVTLNLAGTPLNIRKGSWILDVSQLANPSANQVDLRGDFYRVVGYTTNGTTSISLELQNPVKPNPNPSIPIYNPSNPGAGGTYTGTFIVMDGVVEVFDRGTLSAIGAPAQ